MLLFIYYVCVKRQLHFEHHLWKPAKILLQTTKAHPKPKNTLHNFIVVFMGKMKEICYIVLYIVAILIFPVVSSLSRG